MKKTTQVIYKCDFCNKISISAGAMGNHERACTKNPINKVYCNECAYSTSKDKTYTYDTYTPYGCDLEEREAKDAPYCEYFERYLISPKLAKSSYFELNTDIDLFMPVLAEPMCVNFKHI